MHSRADAIVAGMSGGSNEGVAGEAGDLANALLLQDLSDEFIAVHGWLPLTRARPAVDSNAPVVRYSMPDATGT